MRRLETVRIQLKANITTASLPWSCCSSISFLKLHPLLERGLVLKLEGLIGYCASQIHSVLFHHWTCWEEICRWCCLERLVVVHGGREHLSILVRLKLHTLEWIPILIDVASRNYVGLGNSS